MINHLSFWGLVVAVKFDDNHHIDYFECLLTGPKDCGQRALIMSCDLLPPVNSEVQVNPPAISPGRLIRGQGSHLAVCEMCIHLRCRSDMITEITEPEEFSEAVFEIVDDLEDFVCFSEPHPTIFDDKIDGAACLKEFKEFLIKNGQVGPGLSPRLHGQLSGFWFSDICERQSGLPGLTFQALINSVGGSPRIFVSGCPKRDGDLSSKYCAVSIDDDPEILEGTVTIPDDLIPSVLTWVRQNKNALLRHWSHQTSTSGLYQQIRLLKPVVLQVSTAGLKKRYESLKNDQGWKTPSARRDWKNLARNLKITRVAQKMFPLENILESSSLADALWALEAVTGHSRALRLLACRYARMALPVFENRYPAEMRPLRQALDTAERYARDQADREELASARKTLRAVINPDKNVFHDEDGNSHQKIFKPKSDNWIEYDLPLQYARLAALAAVRDRIEGGVWRAAGHAAQAMALFAGDQFRADPAARNSALRQSAGAIAGAAASAVDILAEEVILATAGQIEGPLSGAAMRDYFTGQAGQEAICSAVEGSYQDSVKNIVKSLAQKEIAAEFLKLCRLESEYARIKEV